MSVFGIFEPSLAWPKSARIGFYGPHQHRRPNPAANNEFCGSPGPSQSLSGAAPGRLSKQGWRPRPAQRPPGEHFGAILASRWTMFASMFDPPALHFECVRRPVFAMFPSGVSRFQTTAGHEAPGEERVVGDVGEAIVNPPTTACGDERV